jgi:amidophosphoribosyltransferase
MLHCAQEQSENFCSACFDGNYPIPVEDGMRNSKLMLEPAGVAAALKS